MRRTPKSRLFTPYFLPSYNLYRFQIASVTKKKLIQKPKENFVKVLFYVYLFIFCEKIFKNLARISLPLRLWDELPNSLFRKTGISHILYDK